MSCSNNAERPPRPDFTQLTWGMEEFPKPPQKNVLSDTEGNWELGDINLKEKASAVFLCSNIS